jgi:hypothetical protein
MSDAGGSAPPPPPPPPSAGGGGPIMPRGLGDILSAAFELYKANAAKLIGIVAIVVIPATLVSTLAWQIFDSGIGVFLAAMIGFAVSFIITFGVQAAVTRAAAQATTGDPIDIETSYRWALTHIGAVFVVSILAALVILGGLILFVIPGLIFAIFLSVAIPALVIEGKTGTDALGRSWNLVKGNFWHAVGVIVVAIIIAGVVSSILTSLGRGNFVLYWLFSAAANVITAPFLALVFVLLYVDLRARAEALTGMQLRDELARGA